jgi:acylphosphatase
MTTERRRVRYAGRVQGVGFRFTARRLAQGFAVTGYVRNEPDGRVEVVAEGEPETIDAFLHEIQRELGDKIRSATTATESPGDPGFDDFFIDY